VGGGALPLLELRGPAVALTADDVDGLAARLRAGVPAVVGRIHEGRLLLDPRTLTDEQARRVGAIARAALELTAGG
ncbi:MAG: L-seryl-tRNA(Sec) selenium transferase, partial [Solirubrobacteraceae bacterium]